MDKTYFGTLYVNGIVPVAVIKDEKTAVPLAAAILEGGIDCIEVTFRTPTAAKSIELIHENFPEMLIGAGTILTGEQAETAARAGASFVVSPGLSLPLIKECNAAKIPLIPGVATATEVITAMENGVTAVKFFPAKQAGGVNYLKAISAVFPDVKFMPTGGIDLENLADYLSISTVFCCGGSFMFKTDDYKKITELSKAAALIVKSKREKRYFYV
ncbi:MAG: bifunctional 4-hydroxy-2-oxoglutarate aldolase/2-dehydro-3-deoxy-phosphogluconate aldolase [Ruminococcus sp.]|jgi:Entner-Doudoroff aldolase|nr:bifunctional 4-hydroxy-2-oxoglutarate aldolase/2-dehydro-3-deoxy-phosphogluconate aldolase [Ruminococcus sp.]